jgi:putative membrane protein
VDDPHEPDERFTLANERTMLAWMRTALALYATGLGVIRFAPELGPSWGREAVGAALVLLGAAAAGVGYARWARVDRSLRSGGPLPSPAALRLLAYSLAGLSLLTVLLFAGRGLLGGP